MKFTVAAVLAVAAGVSASTYGNATVTTEVVDVYTTYCPYATQITHGSKTYTVTEATTLTITDCPCTITKPIYTTSAVVSVPCSTATGAPVPPVYSAPPVYNNVTAPAYTAPAATGTGVVAPTAPPKVPTSGAGKAAALSGAGLAAVVGLAAFVL